MSRCDAIAELVVMGEPLSADDQGHVDGCAACRQLTALPGLLAASTSAEPPRPGFSARMMAATRERLGQRRRRRFAAFTLAVAAAGASAVVVDRRLVRDRLHEGMPSSLPEATTSIEPTLREELQSLGADRVKRAMAPVAPWAEIEAPVRRYGAWLRKGGPK
jgi:hypothetical protein